MVQLVFRMRKVKTKMYSSQPRIKVKTDMARSPFLTCGSTTCRNAWRRDAPSVSALISMSHGTASKKPFKDKDRKGQLEGDEYQNDAEERIQEPDPVEHQEHRDDQRQH